MPVTRYSYDDASAPVLYGAAGGLLTVLDPVLKDGYGAKSGAGWTKPFANSGNVGCYQNAGSGMNLSINDNGPGAGTYKEARLTGYESLSAVATGSGQFPNAAASQGVTPFGFWVARKSATADSSNPRPWRIFADDKTLYMFVYTGDNASYQLAWGFGDFFSLGGSSDAYRGFLVARSAENSATLTNDRLDYMIMPGTATTYISIPRTVGGGGTAILASMHGDVAKTGLSSFSAAALAATGCQTPNSADNAYYLSPVWLVETSGLIIRGRLRGFWHLCHPYSSFTDGQVFTGANDTAGKTFEIVMRSGNTGAYCIETSDTWDTN